MLEILDKIQASYRAFHAKSCFIADKHPLVLADQLCNQLRSLCLELKLRPTRSHRLLAEYERLFEQVRRFNKAFFEDNPLAAGLEQLDFAQLIADDAVADAKSHPEHST